MIESIVKNSFNDKTNNLKEYKKGSKYICDKQRYDELFFKGFLKEGKEIKKKDKKED